MIEVWIIKARGTDNNELHWTVAAYPDPTTAEQHLALLKKKTKTMWRMTRPESIQKRKREIQQELDVMCPTTDGWRPPTYWIERCVFALHVDDYKEKVGIQ